MLGKAARARQARIRENLLRRFRAAHSRTKIAPGAGSFDDFLTRIGTE
jgi:hypothetical protein